MFACELPASPTGADVAVVDGSSCSSGKGAITYALLDAIKQDVCNNPDMDDWAITNGADCSLRGTGYGCQLSHDQDPVAGEILCVDCLGGGGLAGGLGGGALFLIILVSILFIYFVGGILYNKFVKKEGFKPLHAEFWVDLPALVKDGCMFVVNKVKGGGQDKYEEL